jgi:beta-lactamase superfamily II metal-dependent hydrolase
MNHSLQSPVVIRAAAATCIILFLVAIVLSAGCTGLPGITPGSSRQASNDGKLLAYFLDVGQGDSQLILFGNKTILIDAGETEMGDRVVADLQRLGVTRINLLVATHSHSDHIGGMQKVLDAFPVGQVLDAGVPSSSSIYEKFLTSIDRKQIPYMVARQGQTIDLDPALRILVLSPPEKRLNDDPNQNSVALRISYGTTSLLYTGDLGGETEAALAKTGYPLDAQVLKVGHHGSSSSTSPAFLARVHPGVAIISLADDNPYGHPHDETLDRLSGAMATVYRTDRDGTILVRSDGIHYSVTMEKDGFGIWNATATAAPVFTPATTTAESSALLPNISLNATDIVSSIPANITIPATLPPVQIGNASSVYISATQFDAPGDDRENLNGEWVRVANRGDGPVLIAGWTLSDKTGSEPFIFPAILLMPSDSVTVFSGSGTMNDTALYMGRSTPLWGNSGDAAILRDGSGAVIDRKAEGAGA